jgi:3-hydroxyisobutyrate dehydrogenase-like beta-hydroxyacid dehydrogenase
MKVGFVGLGAMGSGMVANLLKRGHHVTVWARSPAPVAAAAELGAVVVKSAAEAFGGDAFISMLSDDNAVREVILDGHVLPRSGSSTVHINMASVSFDFASDLVNRHKEFGIPYVGAPVFGRDDVAAAGRLNVIAAGEPGTIALVMPILEALSARVWNMGEKPEMANLVKICGNFMIGGAIEAIGEATSVWRAQGREPQQLLEVLTAVIFDSPVYRGYGRLVAERKYDPAGFRLKLGLKDMRLALAAGDRSGVPMPLAQLLVRRLEEAVERGKGELDWSAFADFTTLQKEGSPERETKKLSED